MTEPRSKAALLELIERERGLWDELLAEIGEERMLQPGATGEWSFKDVVAHLNGWRVKTLARLVAAHDHSDPAAPPWLANLDEDDEGDVDRINDWIYWANRERPLGAVLGAYRHSFQRMYDATSALSENELNDIGRYPWLAGHRLADVITAAFGHFHDEHKPVLRDWLARIDWARLGRSRLGGIADWPPTTNHRRQARDRLCASLYG